MSVVLLMPLWFYGQVSTTTGTQTRPGASKPNAKADHGSPLVWARKHGRMLENIFRQPDPVVASSGVKKKGELPNAPSYTPLTPKEKFKYFEDYARSPFTFGSALVTAVSWQVYGDPPYGPGAAGFGESYVAAVGQREIAALLGRFVIPTAFHEDPRYFRAPPGENVAGRSMYAISRLFLTKADNGRDRINASYLLGGFASAAIANAYIRNRDYGSVTHDFFLNMGSDAAFNIAREFWPSVRPHFSKKLKKLGNILIGPQGLPNPKEN
jgi:hypothetical protein